MAQATTGTGALTKPPIFKVSKAQAKPFLGSYKLTAHGSGVLNSTFRTGYNGEGYLQGSISITQYSEGQPATWVAALYEYRRRGAEMIADLWSPDIGSALEGHLTLKRSGSDKMTGTLRIDAKNIPVTYTAEAVRKVRSESGTGSSGAASPPAVSDGIFTIAVRAAEALKG